LQRIDNGKRLVKQAPTVFQNEALIVWIVDAAVRYRGDVVLLKSLPALPVLFPYELDCPLAYVVSNSRSQFSQTDKSPHRMPCALCPLRPTGKWPTVP